MQIGNNRATVDDIEQMVGTLDDGVPFVLFPVRIETRFVRREVSGKGDGWSAATQLVSALNDVIQSLTNRDRYLQTRFVGTVKEKRRFKAELEEPRYEFVANQLALALAALDRIARHTREVVEGTEEQAAEIELVTKTVFSEMAAAGRSIGKLRSMFQRKRLQGEMAALQENVQRVLTAVVDRLVPAMRMLPSASIQQATSAASTSQRKAHCSTVDTDCRICGSLQHSSYAHGNGNAVVVDRSCFTRIANHRGKISDSSHSRFGASCCGTQRRGHRFRRVERSAARIDCSDGELGQCTNAYAGA